MRTLIKTLDIIAITLAGICVISLFVAMPYVMTYIILAIACITIRNILKD